MMRVGLLVVIAALVVAYSPAVAAKSPPGPIWISDAYAPFFFGRFEVCNAASEAVDVALLGSPGRGETPAKGWTRIAPRACAGVRETYYYGFLIAARTVLSGRTLRMPTSYDLACLPYPQNFRIKSVNQGVCAPGTRQFNLYVTPPDDLSFQGITSAKLTLHESDFNGQTERKIAFVNFSYHPVHRIAIVNLNHAFEVPLHHPLRSGESITVGLPGFATNECTAHIEAWFLGEGKRMQSQQMDICSTPYLGIRRTEIVGSFLPNYFAPSASPAAALPVAATLPPPQPATPAPSRMPDWTSMTVDDYLSRVCDVWGDVHCASLIEGAVENRCDGPCPGYSTVSASAPFFVRWFREHQNYVNPNGHRLGNQTVGFALNIAWDWTWGAK